jgi:ribonuclease T1
MPIPEIDISGLPTEVSYTISLISSGGIFPHVQDGAEFKNREGVLPSKPSGYYKEYTVATPGASDRGSRRIVIGNGGEKYYTDDHYASFKKIK